MSRGVGKVLGVVAAIALPFAAPAIAGAIGLSSAVGSIAASMGVSGSMIGAVGGAVGSGIVGAVGGAATSALTGGDVGQGALLGGLGGALSGGFSGYKAAKGALDAARTGGAGAGAVAAGAAGATQSAVNVPGSWTTATGSYAPGVTIDGVAQGGAQGLTGTASATGANVAAQGGARTILGNISKSLGNVAPEIMQKAAVYLASGVLSGTSAREQQLIQQAARRMKEIENQDKALYDAMIAEANSISPEDRGMNWYNDAKLQGIAAGEAALENVSPRMQGAIPEVQRRALQDASLNATLAYRQGHESGTNQRRAALGAAAAIPRSNAALGALGLETDAAARRAASASGIRSALGGIFTTDPGENEDPRIGTGSQETGVQMGYI